MRRSPWNRAARAAAALALLCAAGAGGPAPCGADDGKENPDRKIGRKGAPLSTEPPLPAAASASPGGASGANAMTVLVVHATPNCKAAKEEEADCAAPNHWSARIGNEYLSGKPLAKAIAEKADAARPERKAPTRLTVVLKTDRRCPFKVLQGVIRACEDLEISRLELLTSGGSLAIGHPHRAGADLFNVEEVRVNVSAGDAGAPVLTLKGGPCKDDAEALRVIQANLNAKKLKSKYVPVYVDADGSLPISAVTHALDLCVKAGAEDFEFFAAPEKKK